MTGHNYWWRMAAAEQAPRRMGPPSRVIEFDVRDDARETPRENIMVHRVPPSISKWVGETPDEHVDEGWLWALGVEVVLDDSIPAERIELWPHQREVVKKVVGDYTAALEVFLGQALLRGVSKVKVTWPRGAAVEYDLEAVRWRSADAASSLRSD